MADFFIDLFNMSITASYLVLAVVVARLLLKKAPKWVSCLLWGLVGIRLVCPISFESALSLIPNSQTIKVNDFSQGRPFAVESGIPVVDTNVNELISSNYYEGITVPVNTFANVTDVLSIIWLVGVFAMLVYGLISYIRLRKNVSASVCDTKNKNVYFCDDIDTPFILGVFKPKIYIPSGLTAEQVEYIIMHERAHLKRRDHFWKPIAFILLSVYWFNPVIWSAYVLLCRDIESACDEKVIKNMLNHEKKHYSETLVSCSVQRRMVMVCPLAFGEVGVKQRIKSILNYKKPAFWVVVLSLVLISAVAVCFVSNPIDKTADKILSEDGYEHISVEEKDIHIQFSSSVLTDKMFEKDGTYKVRSRDILQDITVVSLKEVRSYADQFVFTFAVDYENIPEKGTIYFINANQIDGGLELGDEISVSDPFGATTENSVYRTYCTSQGPKREFSFQVPKEWFEGRRDNKILLRFEALVIEFKEEGYKDEDEGKNYTYATSKAGAFYRIKDSYYQAVINKNAEYQETGLFFFEADGDKRLVCKLGSTLLGSLLVENSLYYIQDDNRLYSVELKEDTQPQLVAEKLYQQEKTYSIEKIVSSDAEYVYCKAKLYGVRDENPDWDVVYLKINRANNEFSEVSKNDMPVDEYQFDAISGNIESTLDSESHSIYVKGYRVKHTKRGSIESAIFNVWVPSDDYDEGKPGTVGNVLVTEDYTVFFNVIKENVALSDFKGSEDLPTMYQVMEQAEESIAEIKDSKGSISGQEYYIINEGDDSSFSVKEKHSNEPVTEKAEPDEPETDSASQETQDNAIVEIDPPKTTGYIDYFTPDGERVFAYVGGPWD